VDPRHRAIEMRMRHMRLVAQAIDDPEVEVGERLERRVVETDHVGRIGHAPETESGRIGAESVVLLERHDRNAGYGKRSVKNARLEQRAIKNARSLLCLPEDIAETLAQDP